MIKLTIKSPSIRYTFHSCPRNTLLGWCPVLCLKPAFHALHTLACVFARAGAGLKQKTLAKLLICQVLKFGSWSQFATN
jgi:hypothetical protein